MNKVMQEIARARHSADLTQEGLATKAGLSRLTVQGAEAGRLDPKLSSVLEMARALGLDLMVVPTALRPELEAFIQSGGKFIGQSPGIGAPKSIVDNLIQKPSGSTKKK